jgi:hypothetical protein
MSGVEAEPPCSASPGGALVREKSREVEQKLALAERSDEMSEKKVAQLAHRK